ncbi:MAG: hypothetical protein ACWA41_12610 [Putridiphycobacter sp.]
MKVTSSKCWKELETIDKQIESLFQMEDSTNDQKYMKKRAIRDSLARLDYKFYNYFIYNNILWEKRSSIIEKLNHIE